MNAGALGGETWKHVIDVDTLDRQGMRRTRPAAQFEVGYRHVQASGATSGSSRRASSSSAGPA